VHKPAKVGAYDQLLYHDSVILKIKKASIKNGDTLFIINYILRNDSCKICHLWYKERFNQDTFSIKTKAKYSNLKYPKH
jgi:hypothetical protein